MADNLTIGRGRMLFAPFLPGTQNPSGERYLGNTPAFSLSADVQKLEHYNSDRKVKDKDRSAIISSNWKGSLTTDNVDPDNIAMAFFGSAATLSASAVTGQTDTIVGVKQGLEYQIGTTVGRPSGARKLTTVVVKVSASAKTLGTDYTLDADRGRVTIVPGGAITDGATITVEYGIAASTRSQIISGSTPLEGAIRFLADNADGANLDYFAPWARLTPTGEYALKSDSWLQISFELEIQRKVPFEALYIDGQAVTS